MAEIVEVIDLKTDSVSVVPSDQIGPGMIRIRHEGKNYWADSSQIQRNEYQHNPFEGEMKSRIESIMNNLSEVYSLSYKEWEDGFRRDKDPINEIAIWEHIVSIYERFSKNVSNLSLKREIFSVVSTCSYSGSGQVLNQVTLEVLTKEQAKKIIHAYYQKT